MMEMYLAHPQHTHHQPRQWRVSAVCVADVEILQLLRVEDVETWMNGGVASSPRDTTSVDGVSPEIEFCTVEGSELPPRGECCRIKDGGRCRAGGC